MLRDVEFFRSRISKLDGAADLGDHLVNVVNNKSVAEASKPSDPPIAKAEDNAEKPPDAGENT